MLTQEVIGYISEQLQSGASRQNIEQVLRSAGWQESDINEAFRGFQPGDIQVEPPEAIFASIFLSPDTLLRYTVRIFRKIFWKILGVELISILIVIIPLVVTAVIFLSMGVAASFLAGNMPILYILFSVLLVVLVVFAVIIGPVWGQNALLYMILRNHQNLSIREAYRLGWKKIRSYFWISFLIGATVMAGIFLFVIPGIIFFLWFSFAFYILLGEDIRGLNALLKSREYTKGRLLDLFWRGLVLVVVTIPFYALSIVVSLLDFRLLEIIVQVIISFITTPMVLIYNYLIYKNLRALRRLDSFVPTRKSRVTFILLALLGLSAPVILIFMPVLFLFISRI